MKNRIIIALLLIFGFILCGCSNSKLGDSKQVIAESTITEDSKFGAAVVALSQEEFEALGFTLGDSCNVEFGNGVVLEDVPYFNGYYVKNGEGVIVAYPGSSNLSITYNNLGEGMLQIWDKEDLTDGDKVTITLNQAGKYLPIQSALGQIYSFIRKDYKTDEEFCNFRALSGGNLKTDFLYRGASPVDNSRGRAAYTDGLLKSKSIQTVIDLADSETNITSYTQKEDFKSEYTLSLYQNNKMILLDMGSAYTSAQYQAKVVEGLKKIIECGGPAYIHCMEGKDRTGFVCMLIEALASASYDEMLTDYMITYQNYYKVTKDGTNEKYEAIADLYFNAFVSYLHGTEDLDVLKAADYTQDAKDYLIAGGMTEAEINQLLAIITE